MEIESEKSLSKENRTKPKLLYFVESFGGGVFTYIVDLANELCDDYDIYIGYAIRSQTPKNYQKYFDKRIHLIRVKNFSRSFNLNKNFKAFLEMKKISKEVDPDIIHLHSSMAGVLGRWAFNGKKIPLFYTPHGYSFLMKNFSNKKRTIFKFIETICAKRNCTTISCSAGENQETLKMTSRAIEIDNGVNAKQLNQLLNSIDTSSVEHFDVFTLGRITAQKNPTQFNEIALKMPDLKFLWIGDGELRNMLTAPNITVSGWVDRETALKYSLNSKIFVLTSLWEGLPMSLLEAMYMKKVCIVSDVIGNHDVIHNDKNGYVCGSTDDFIKAISDAEDLNNTDLVKNAYSEVLNHYNTDVMSKKYNQAYKNALDFKIKGR